MDLTIAKLARMVQLTPRTLRYYESIGLMPDPYRTSGNYRVYCEEDVIRLVRIKRLTDLGLSLSQVAQLLDRPDADASEDVLAELSARLEAEGRQIRERQQTITRITKASASLDTEAEFAERLARQAGPGVSDAESEHGHMIVDTVVALGTPNDRIRMEWLFEHADALTEVPEFLRLNALDKDLMDLPEEATDPEIQKMVEAYVAAHAEADTLFPPGVARMWSLGVEEVLEALLENRFHDAQVEVRRRVRSIRRA
ncbi:MAG: MerR family transcriptional regulator [Bifidobacteriaceae bacterium]|nr:MerR family transcriptional regulator [Bifidobacteriaceae bacterium]